MNLEKQFPAPHNQVAGRIVDGEAVLVLAGSGQVQVLNEVGARVWELADGTRSLADIVRAIVEEFEVESDAAAVDVTAFIDRLVAEQILVMREGPLPGA